MTRVDLSIKAIRCGVCDAQEFTSHAEASGLHVPAFIASIATGGIEHGPRANNHGIAGRQGYVATLHGELRDVSLYEIQISREVAQGSPHPVAPIVVATLAQVDREIDSPQGSRTLEGRVCQLEPRN